jgi:hypothetical protein
MHRFLIAIEKAGKNFPAYSHSPDLPGCVAQERHGRTLKIRCMRQSGCISGDFTKTVCRSEITFVCDTGQERLFFGQGVLVQENYPGI